MTIIAIDGPSGSGKSTVARLLAQQLQLPYLDTGAMYRAVGMVAREKGVPVSDAPALVKVAAEMKLELLDEYENGELKPRVVVNGVDCTLAIRTPEVSQAASAVGIHPEVRERLVRRQRNWVEVRGGGVVEGRDIGTVVFPDADVKVYLTASEEERARRRMTDPNAPGFSALSGAQTEKEIASRDARDSSRAASPLKVAADALVIDSSDMSPSDITARIVRPS